MPARIGRDQTERGFCASGDVLLCQGDGGLRYIQSYAVLQEKSLDACRHRSLYPAYGRKLFSRSRMALTEMEAAS